MASFSLECPAPLTARGFRLDAETAEHLPFLRHLFIRQRWEQFAPLPWNDAEKIALLDNQFDLQHRQYLGRFPDGLFLVPSDPDGPVGRFYVAEDGADLRVVDILLVPERRGQGIGGALLAGLTETATALGRMVTLHVDKGNPAALLYQRLGFRVTADAGVSWQMDRLPG